MRRILGVVVAATLTIGSGVASPAAAAPDAGVVAGSWVVQLVPGSNARAEAPRLARRYGGRVGHVYEKAITGFSFKGSDRAAANLRRNPKVRSVEADRVLRAVGASQVPTGVRRVESRNGDGTTAVASSAGAGVRVAVLDTGVDASHEQLANRVVRGKDCTSEGDATKDGNGHGTHVAGTVAGTEVGVASAATIVAVKVLDSSGSGSWSSVICGIDYVTALNTNRDSSGALIPGDDVKVANMSLGGSSSESATSCSSSSLHQAICNSVNSGALYAVAAGNDKRDASGFVPAKYPEVVTVSAFSDLDGARDPEAGSECKGTGPWKDCDETFARFSNYGTIVDVMAPGVRIYSSVPGGYDTYSGTSMAAPHVAGVAALVIEDNTLSVDHLTNRLKATGECPGATWASSTGTCSGSWSGDGDTIAEPMVNAQRAVAGTDTGTTTNTAPAAADLSASVTSGSSVEITLSGTDAEQCELGFTIATPPSKGSLGSISSVNCTAGAPNRDTAKVTYTPNATSTDTSDSFTYTVSDGSLTHTATVTITITGSGTSTTTSLQVAGVNYLQYGGKTRTNHFDITITVTDGSGAAVANATVAIDLLRKNSDGTTSLYGSGTGTTGSDGKVTFSVKSPPSGCYTTDVTRLESGTTVNSDPSEPANEVCK